MSGGLEELYGDEGAPAAADVVTQTTPESAPVEPAANLETAPSEVQAPLVETPAAVAPPVTAEPQDPMAPVKALLDERDRRQAAERRAQETARELAAIRARDAEQQRKAQEAANQLPHPLDDPEGFAAGVRALTNQAVRQVQSQTQEQQDRVVETLSRNALKRHIGNEQFSELEKFAQAAPDQAHNLAYESGDPWGWMYEKLQEAKKHRQAQSALQELGDMSLQDRIAQAVAAERAKWEAEHGGGQPQPAAQPARAAPPQGPDGKFISPATQRHTPQSLAEINGAAVVASNGSSGLALEELYNN